MSLNLMRYIQKGGNESSHLEKLNAHEALGEVVLQDRFQMIISTSIFQRIKERYIFLYEGCLIFAKQHTHTDGIKQYEARSKLMLSEMNVNQNVSRYSTMFEIRTSTKRIMLQAQTIEQKYRWVDKIMSLKLANAAIIYEVPQRIFDEPIITKEEINWGTKWWENELKITRTPKAPKLQDPLEVVEGTITQGDIESIYAGAQCTSVCLEAVSYWQHKKRKVFTPADIDHVIYTGTFLHQQLREELRVSNDLDLRVSLDDLPKKCELANGEFFRHRWSLDYLTLISSHDQGEMRSLRDFLLGYADAPFGVVLTIEQYSIALMYCVDKRWMVYDSHGHIQFEDFQVENASCWLFANIDAITVFLNRIRPHDGYCTALKPFILHDNDRTMSQSEGSLYATVFNPVEEANISSSCEAKLESGEFCYDEDPYVSLMGGFGGYF